MSGPGCSRVSIADARGESPIGTWTITVKDRVNPETTGRFVAWSLQLWGEAVDADLTKPWAPAEAGEPDEEEIGSDPTATAPQKKPKPTDHLPDDHGHAEGEADQPGLGEQPTSPAVGDDIAEPTASHDSSEADEGFFDGIEKLGKNSSWVAGAGIIVVLAGAAVGSFFLIRAKRRRRQLFGLSNNGEGARGAYQPVGDEDVPMGLLERGRRKLGGTGGAGGGGSKELYDAFGDGPSDDSDDGEGGDERTALRYHDDFLGDEDDDPERAPPVYRDEPEIGKERSRAEGSGTREGTPLREVNSQSGSSSSWQDAAEEVPPRV